MSAKSAMETRFKNREGIRIITVPKSMRPTTESIAKWADGLVLILEEIIQ